MSKKAKYSFNEVIGIANDKFQVQHNGNKIIYYLSKTWGFPNELSFKLLSYNLYTFFSFIYNNILLYIFFYYIIIYINLI